ncbi:MAG: single-stranded DNA-binding protein [Abitibacteriaceae bacterium]|nr:single-stranded DNA-binding protein [Abditibacteriaceae bacterium]
MPSYNRVILICRLTRDPELRYTAGGSAVTTFSLAVDRRFKNQQTGERQTDFFRCKAWRQKAEFVANYVGKGRLVAVEGSIEISEVTGPDGQKKYFTDIVCDNVESLDAPRDGAGGEGQAHGGADMHAGADGAGNAGGYYPEEDAAPPAPVAAAPARPAPRAAAGANAAPAGGGAGGARAASGGQAARPAAQGAGSSRAAAPARQPQPTYPEDDFDDSDPFADE